MAQVRKLGRPLDQAKREAIAHATRTLMAEHGFDFSIEQVAVRAKVARQTIYNTYANKDALIAALMMQTVDDMIGDMNVDQDMSDPERVLTNLGMRYLEMTSSRVDIIRTLASSESIARGYGVRFYELGPRVLRDRLAAFLERAHQLGHLHAPNPHLAADLFLSMVVGTRQLRALLGVEEPAPLSVPASRVVLAVRMMLAGLAGPAAKNTSTEAEL